MKQFLRIIWASILLLATTSMLIAQTAVSGTIIDGSTQEFLVGATITIKGGRTFLHLNYENLEQGEVIDIFEVVIIS